MPVKNSCFRLPSLSAILAEIPVQLTHPLAAADFMLESVFRPSGRAGGRASGWDVRVRVGRRARAAAAAVAAAAEAEAEARVTEIAKREREKEREGEREESGRARFQAGLPAYCSQKEGRRGGSSREEERFGIGEGLPHSLFKRVSHILLLGRFCKLHPIIFFIVTTHTMHALASFCYLLNNVVVFVHMTCLNVFEEPMDTL
jgi:hypothetical protein